MRWMLAFFTFSRFVVAAGEIAPVEDSASPDRLNWAAKIRDPQDGCIDLSRFLNEPLGFIPLVLPITEPAVGSGAALIPVFIDKPDGPGRPSITGIGAMKTSNGSRGAFAAFSRYYLDQRLHLSGGVADLSINLDYNGLGSISPPGGSSIQYNLEMRGGMIGADWRLGDSDWRLGLRYTYADIDLSFKRTSAAVQRDLLGRLNPAYTVSSLKPSIVYDSRDNIFTPTSGMVWDLNLAANIEALGGGSDYQVLTWNTLWYRPLIEDTLFFGVKGQVEQSFGDLPFYTQPYIKLRGAPISRYQGEGVASIEAELRWQFHPRWSLLGFAGTGVTWSDRLLASDSQSATTGGVGFRYLLAREHGLHMGIDAAYGEEGAAFYVQFGSAWGRF